MSRNTPSRPSLFAVHNRKVRDRRTNERTYALPACKHCFNFVFAKLSSKWTKYFKVNTTWHL